MTEGSTSKQDTPSNAFVVKPPPSPPENVRLALVALALTGKSNITGFLAVCHAVGARESGARQFTAKSLLEALKPYLEAGWVVHHASTYECAYGLRPRLLRSLSPAQLVQISSALKTGPRGHYYGHEALLSGYDLEVTLGLAGGNPEWPLALERLLSFSEPPEVAARLIQEPLHGAFEREWFDNFSHEEQQQLTGLLLGWCEVSALRLGLFQEYAAEPRSVVQSTPELREIWARLQLLYGGAATVSPALAAECSEGSGVAFLRSMVAADYDSARAWLERAFGGKRQRLLAGCAGVFQVLLLLRGAVAGDLNHALRLATAGAKKGNGFRESFAALKRLLTSHVGGRGVWFDVLEPRGSYLSDSLFELVQGWSTLWFKELEPGAEFVHRTSRALLQKIENQGSTWVSEQYRDVVTELARSLPKAHVNRAQIAYPPLRLLFVQKPAWETALGRLEGLAVEAPGAQEQTSGERVLWRVGHEIEPYLQKLSTSGWTRGRRLAVKHLMPGAAQRASLPPEDLRVADHARESVSQNYSGYREVSYSFDRGAWDALIGHPRVFIGESDTPTEVVRGTLQLLAETKGEQFKLSMYPDDVSEQQHVRREGDRLAVYPITRATQRVLEVIGKGLVVPAAQRERLLAAAARLTHLVPLQSSEPALSDARVGDPQPYFRLTPRGAGLGIALVVRPLGDRGPACLPGAGSPLILAHLAGSTAQARRDLALETKQAAAVIAACPSLGGFETAEYEWSLDTPEACLDLLGALEALGDRVRVEWPQGKALSLRARLDRTSLRGRISRGKSGFLLEANLNLDQELDLSLYDLLRLLSEQRGRFVKLAQGDFVELSAELREQLSAIAAASPELSEGGSGPIELPVTALSALEGLLTPGSGIAVDAPTRKWRDEFSKVFDSKPRLPRGLNAELRDYQLDGFRWLARLGELGFGACLADDMGLGKTVQLIALLLHRARTGPALVVAPTSVGDNWLRELARFAPSLKAHGFTGADRARLLEDLGPRDVIVTGYATLQQDAARLQAITWGTLILDEAQFIKNAQAQRTRAALALRASMRIAATGTPVENHADDLYSLFQFVQPGLLGSAAAFRRRFPLDEDSAAGRDSRRNLRKLIQPFLLRRTKAQVLAELPPVTEIEHQVELSAEETAIYESIRRAAVEKLGSNGNSAGPRNEGANKFAILAELTKLRRVCCDARLVVPEARIESSKLAAFAELMDELVSSGHRALVFSQFVDVLELAASSLESRGKTYQYLDGSSTTKQRSAAVDAFQAGEGDAFLISLKAGGFGLNLTAADYVIHLDPWWNPAAESQATDRAHRIGQQNPVTVYRLVAKGTIEERIVSLHRSKRDLADSLLAESDRASTLSSDDLRLLLEG